CRGRPRLADGCSRRRRPRPGPVSAGAWTALAGFVLVLAPPVTAAPRPDVVVILVDTLRVDRLGCYGSSRSLTPAIDALAARGVVFRNAYAASSWTKPSLAALFTSRLPPHHRAPAAGSVA